MAIVVEEENRTGGNWGSIGVWAVVFVVAIIAAYYIFFKRPDLVEVATPADFQNIEQLSTLQRLHPDEVVNSPQFRSLVKYADPISPISAGRPNPFLQ